MSALKVGGSRLVRAVVQCVSRPSTMFYSILEVSELCLLVGGLVMRGFMVRVTQQGILALVFSAVLPGTLNKSYEE